MPELNPEGLGFRDLGFRGVWMADRFAWISLKHRGFCLDQH